MSTRLGDRAFDLTTGLIAADGGEQMNLAAAVGELMKRDAAAAARKPQRVLKMGDITWFRYTGHAAQSDVFNVTDDTDSEPIRNRHQDYRYNKNKSTYMNSQHTPTKCQ